MDHQHDEEAVPPLPQEDRAPAAKDERRRPFLMQWRTVLAAVSVVLVATTGVVALTRSGSQASDDLVADGVVDSQPFGDAVTETDPVEDPTEPSEHPLRTSHAPGSGSVDDEAPADETAGANGAGAHGAAEESSELPGTDAESTPDTPSNEHVDDEALGDEHVSEEPSEIPVSSLDTSDTVDDNEWSETTSSEASDDEGDSLVRWPVTGGVSAKPAEISTFAPETTSSKASDDEGDSLVRRPVTGGVSAMVSADDDIVVVSKASANDMLGG